MLKYILALLMLLPAQVLGGVFVGFGQSTGGTLLVGNNSVIASAWDSDSAQGAHYDLFTAPASGNIARGYSNLRAGGSGRNCKMLVWTSTGTIVATSAAASIPETATDVEFTFSSGSITSSTQYYIGTVCDGYVDRGHNNVAWNSSHQTNNYTTPTDLTAPSDGNTGRGILKIWVEN